MADSTTLAPVIEYIAPAPAMTHAAFSQRLSPVHTATTVTTDDNLDISGLMSPQSSGIDVEVSAPQAVVSVTEPVYNQNHLKHLVTGELTHRTSTYYDF